jgi:hypothetical protein
MARAVLGKVLYLLLAGAMPLFAAAPAAGQVCRCAPRDDMVSTLGERFKEKEHAYGQLNRQAIIEIFVSDKGGWTIVITGIDGISCVLAAGIGWETLPASVGDHVGMQAAE